MAWYALYKWFIKFRKKSYVNYINIYNQHIYDEWFDTLSKEDQERILTRQKNKKRLALAKFSSLFPILESCTNGLTSEYMNMNRII